MSYKKKNLISNPSEALESMKVAWKIKKLEVMNNLKDKNCLVVGGAGFIGSHLLTSYYP